VSHLIEQLQATLGPAYRLEHELGGGGMSRVFVAHEVALGRKVAVKVLLPELAAGVSVDRFRREILFAAQLQHPHIVPLLSAGESEGLPYFTMPFIAGETLGVKLARTGASTCVIRLPSIGRRWRKAAGASKFEAPVSP
jgi:serine/threonine protein kinase